jgi:hypothetical protein
MLLVVLGLLNNPGNWMLAPYLILSPEFRGQEFRGRSFVDRSFVRSFVDGVSWTDGEFRGQTEPALSQFECGRKCQFRLTTKPDHKTFTSSQLELRGKFIHSHERI